MNILEQMKQDFDKFIKECEKKLDDKKDSKKMICLDDIDKLCRFWNDNVFEFVTGVLELISEEEDEESPYLMEGGNWYKNCRRLTPIEVEEITGYKVEV